MLDFASAQALLAEAAPAPERGEAVAVRAARGRVLAHDFVASFDMPPADNSAMDGYALRAADYQPGRVLPIQQRCYAGDAPEPLAAGNATRLFTGSLVPEGADTVVMQENCRETPDGVELLQPPQPGQHIRRRGEDVAAGRLLVPRGRQLRAADVALLAAQGASEVTVFPRVRVAVLTTGDELVQPGAPRAPQQIYDSNGAMLAALVEGMGAEVVRVAHAGDDVAALTAAFGELAAVADLVLSVGGVSVGERDLVKPTLESLGGELGLWKVRMKPGKPVALGRLGNVPVVCLPGNPVSAFAVFTVLVSPLVRRLQGRAPLLPPTRQAVLRTPRRHGDSREEFLRVQAEVDDEGRLLVRPYAGQSSGIMSALPWATGLARVPAGSTVGDGDLVAYHDFADWLA